MGQVRVRKSSTIGTPYLGAMKTSFILSKTRAGRTHLPESRAGREIGGCDEIASVALAQHVWCGRPEEEMT
jgi:hypothetical protein